MKNKKYYQLVTHQDRSADLYIYGHVRSWRAQESDVSSYSLAKELQELDVDRINIYINSYGGEVTEATAIYNLLRSHKAHVVTVCDGFACSAASVIFMAGDERLMHHASRLMIHNAMMGAYGNADAMRKAADDLDSINELSINAYLSHVNITRDKLEELMGQETWIKPEDAVRMGFASGIVSESDTSAPTQSALSCIIAALDGEKPAVSTVQKPVQVVSEFLSALGARGKD